jgi:hypothetical protein
MHGSIKWNRLDARTCKDRRDFWYFSSFCLSLSKCRGYYSSVLSLSARQTYEPDVPGIPQQSIAHPLSACTCPCASGSIGPSSSNAFFSSGSCSGVGKGNSEPKKACCMTGSLPSTSASYIFLIPSLTFDQLLTAVMSSSMGECQRSEAVLMELMKEMQERYM